MAEPWLDQTLIDSAHECSKETSNESNVLKSTARSVHCREFKRFTRDFHTELSVLDEESQV